MLDDAIDLLPPAKLHKIVRKYLDLKRLHPDSEKATDEGELAKLARLAGIPCRSSFRRSDGISDARARYAAVAARTLVFHNRPLRDVTSCPGDHYHRHNATASAREIWVGTRGSSPRAPTIFLVKNAELVIDWKIMQINRGAGANDFGLTQRAQMLSGPGPLACNPCRRRSLFATWSSVLARRVRRLHHAK